MGFGYATDETEDCMPLTHSIATRLGKKLTDVRKSGDLWWLRPDGKTQVTIEYLQRADGSVEPQKIHTVVISTQHAEPSQAVRRLHGCRDDGAIYGRDEQAHRRESDQGDFAGNQAQERQGGPFHLWRLRAFAHQPHWQVHHRWSTGRRRPHGPQDHHRHLRRLGCPRRWRFLWQGPD